MTSGGASASADAPQTPVSIVTPTAELMAQYERDGFLVLPDVLSPDEVDELRADAKVESRVTFDV